MNFNKLKTISSVTFLYFSPWICNRAFQELRDQFLNQFIVLPKSGAATGII
jgi:hypothetical protein